MSMQAILPDSWESSSKGKELRRFLRKHKSARVKVTGLFEAGTEPYGNDMARFRFTITEISSVDAAHRIDQSQSQKQ